MNWRIYISRLRDRAKALPHGFWVLAKTGFAQAMVLMARLARLMRLHIVGQKLAKTRLGQNVLARWHKGVDIYRKLTSPPPDPLMAAMMMQGVEIDIDEDPTALQGNKLFTMIGAFFVIMVLWAALTELDEVVRAEGTIVPPSSVQLVQNRLPGSVAIINAKLGDRVNKGDVLYRLEDEDVIANFDDNEVTRIAALAAISRLTAEADGATDLAFPDWMEANAPDVAASERAVFERRQRALTTRLKSLNRRIKNLDEKIDILRPLVEGGHEARLTLVEAEGEYNAARDEYEAVIANYRAEAARELAEVKTRANQAGAREDAFRAKVRHADVRAPAAGIVTAVHVKTIGAVVQAGTVLAEIVPDEQAVLVQARILSEDIGGVYPGQIAQVSLSAYDVSRYGNLEGEVQRIAQNTTQEQNMPPFYETLIAIPIPKLSKSDDEVEIVPGMTVMVDLIGQKRTVLNYIMTPLNRAAGVAFREN